MVKKISEEDRIQKNLENYFEKIMPLEEQKFKNKPEENMKNIFEDISQIKGFQIVNSTPRSGRFSKEPYDGNINYNGKLYYFKFSHEFDEGNTYIVYDNNSPIFYFLLYSDYDGDVNSPMIQEPR